MVKQFRWQYSGNHPLPAAITDLAIGSPRTRTVDGHNLGDLNELQLQDPVTYTRITIPCNINRWIGYLLTQPLQDLHPPSSPNMYTSVSRQSAVSLCYQDHELTLQCLAQEGGAPLINFLLAKATPSDYEHDKTLLPATSKVREWQFRDILQLRRRNGRLPATKNQSLFMSKAYLNSPTCRKAGESLKIAGS